MNHPKRWLSHLFTQRLTPRLAASTVVAAASVWFFALSLHREKIRLETDLETESRLLSEALREAVDPAAADGDWARVRRISDRFGNRGRLAGVAVYGLGGEIAAATGGLAELLKPTPRVVAECLKKRDEGDAFASFFGRKMHIHVLPLKTGGAIAVLHDVRFIEARLERDRKANLRKNAVQVGLFALVLIVIGEFLAWTSGGVRT